MSNLSELIVLIKGAGEIASGIAHRLHRCHFRVCLTETDNPLAAPVSGILRGLIRSGVRVSEGDKLIEIDPVNDRSVCFTSRDKMRAIAGGVLEAIMMMSNRNV